jgi:hypothetical protein
MPSRAWFGDTQHELSVPVAVFSFGPFVFDFGQVREWKGSVFVETNSFATEERNVREFPKSGILVAKVAIPS